MKTKVYILAETPEHFQSVVTEYKGEEGFEALEPVWLRNISQLDLSLNNEIWNARQLDRDLAKAGIQIHNM